eukprot:CAMPEP_0196709724 /NCGR_PEP_ID=MMETSP1090-20130531/68683_1 /TAXON_ID=37098 /ORGANISM="Isochrysis sp, Strain CCMP1244" /LENGTH=292 /DNA_ID=CAMNT_0042049743 /DNA_START=54 /DNA_END=929 /DNA_ORIENTATION=+
MDNNTPLALPLLGDATRRLTGSRGGTLALSACSCSPRPPCVARDRRGDHGDAVMKARARTGAIAAMLGVLGAQNDRSGHSIGSTTSTVTGRMTFADRLVVNLAQRGAVVAAANLCRPDAAPSPIDLATGPPPKGRRLSHARTLGAPQARRPAVVGVSPVVLAVGDARQPGHVDSRRLAAGGRSAEKVGGHARVGPVVHDVGNVRVEGPLPLEEAGCADGAQPAEELLWLGQESGLVDLQPEVGVRHDRGESAGEAVGDDDGHAPRRDGGVQARGDLRVPVRDEAVVGLHHQG